MPAGKGPEQSHWIDASMDAAERKRQEEAKKSGMRLTPFPTPSEPGDGALASKVKPKRIPKPIVKPKLKSKPFQRLSPREAAELKQSGVDYEGIPEGSVPATVLSGSGGAGMSARDRAEMGMKKGRSVKKMKKGRKVRGAGIARKGVRAAKMR